METCPLCGNELQKYGVVFLNGKNKYCADCHMSKSLFVNRDTGYYWNSPFSEELEECFDKEIKHINTSHVVNGDYTFIPVVRKLKNVHFIWIVEVKRIVDGTTYINFKYATKPDIKHISYKNFK